MNVGLFALTMTLAPVAAPPAPPVAPMVSPFLFVKIVAPKGSTTTWYPATKAATTTDIPVGLRAGYCYRLEIGNLPDHPNMPIYPSIEVKGSLIIRDHLDVTKHPVPVTLTDDDIQQIYDGKFISKVYYLEDPRQADGGQIVPGQPLETTVSSEDDAMKEARQKGRIVIVLRVGERGFAPEELARGNVPGTILFAGAKAWPRPAAPPCVPYGNIALYDPRLGAKLPEEECFFDGGDRLRPLGIGDGRKLYGVDPSDTAIEFTTPQGRKFATSNRVCICIPRFAALRSEMSPNGYIAVRNLQASRQLEKNNLVATKVPSKTINQAEQFVTHSATSRPSGMQAELSLEVRTTLVGKPTAVYSSNGSKAFAELREVNDITAFPGCNLLLQKRMDPPNPQRIGEEVTFFLRFSNPTENEMTEVIINDSLTGRLEYVPDSQKSSRPATFTATGNEAGSLHLKWAIDGKILPGESGVVSFRARIR